MGRSKRRQRARRHGQPPRDPRLLRWLLGLAAISGTLLLVGTLLIRADRSDGLSPSRPGSNGLRARREQLSRLQVPPDGAALYGFMMKNIPDIVSKVECACCGEPLSACYQGRCPFT